jgi:hypothetical protein
MFKNLQKIILLLANQQNQNSFNLFIIYPHRILMMLWGFLFNEITIL